MPRLIEIILAILVAVLGGVVLVMWPERPGSPAEPEPVETEAPVLPDGEADPGSEPVEPEPGPADVEPEPAEEPVAEPDGPLLDEGLQAVQFMPPGDLAPESGVGQAVQINYVPGMRFPLEAGQAYANSQVYGHGGFLGPGGGQCDTANYSYAWRDNFCEIRGYSTPMCPSGTGHQGQDIRPASCEDALHWAVAADDGVITSVGSYSVRLMSPEGVRYTYLHLDRPSLLVVPGEEVVRGRRLGRVSNEFGGNPTTIHLHFEIKMAVETGQGLQNTNIPPYLALVESYQALLTAPESEHG